MLELKFVILVSCVESFLEYSQSHVHNPDDHSKFHLKGIEELDFLDG